MTLPTPEPSAPPPGLLRRLRVKRYLVTGLLTMFPLWLTWVVFEFILRQLSKLSLPWIEALLNGLTTMVPLLGRVLDLSWLRFLIAVLVTLLGLYFLGWLTDRMVGRRLLSMLDNFLGRIPLVQSIYGGAKKLLTVLQTRPEGAQRVVLIDFPHREMKAIGFVTRIVRETETGEELAAVYVPTTPNPTSGYLEIVPVSRLTPTDWSVDQAMAFIISGGAVAPASMPYRRPGEIPAGTGEARGTAGGSGSEGAGTGTGG